MLRLYNMAMYEMRTTAKHSSSSYSLDVPPFLTYGLKLYSHFFQYPFYKIQLSISNSEAV